MPHSLRVRVYLCVYMCSERDLYYGSSSPADLLENKQHECNPSHSKYSLVRINYAPFTQYPVLCDKQYLLGSKPNQRGLRSLLSLLLH